MENKTLKVLLIENNPGDSVLFQNHLNESNNLNTSLSSVNTLNEAIIALSENLFSVIFTNLALPDSKGLDTLKHIISIQPRCPVIVITGIDNDKVGLSALKMGAEDFLAKSELNSFVIEKSITYAIERRRLTTQLIESESRFRRMFEYSSIGIFRSTSSGQLIEVNKAFADIFGYSKPEEVLANIQDITNQLYVIPSIRIQFMDEFENRSQKFKQIEADFYKKDGSIFTGQLHIRRSDESKANNFVVEGFVQDITEKKKTDLQIETSLQFLKDVMDNIPSPVFTKDKYLRFTGCNQEFVKYVGFAESKILGKTILELRSGDAIDHIHHMDKELLKLKEKQVFEHTVEYSDGKLHDVIFHKNIIKDQQGEANGIIGLILDITDKKQALEKLREELSLTSAMTQLSKQLLQPGISIHEISHLILNFTKSITQSEHGYGGTIDQKNEDLILHSYSGIMIGKDVFRNPNPRFSKVDDEYPHLWGHALNTLQAFYTNSPNTHQKSTGTPKGHAQLQNFLSVPAVVNGKLVGQIALANSTKPFDEDDLENVKMLTNLFSLAIEKQQSIEEMINAREKAELSDKLKSAFLANMSHEIRTPLNAIVGFAQMLGEEGIGLEETNEFKGVIIKNTDVLLRLISDIIEMAMIEAGELKIHPENRPVDETMKQIHQVWKMNSEVTENEDKIQFKIDAPDQESPDKIFKIDTLRFTQIIDNLLMNSFRFTVEGQVTLGYHFNLEGHVVIFVKDTGVGISKEDQLTIFDRFRQVDEHKVRPFSGTGLGLAITRKLVEHLWGDIWVESEVGSGSTFYIKFPLDAKKTISQPKIFINGSIPSDLIPQTSINGQRILIVEDNDSSFDFLEILLKRKGANIQRAHNGLEAVEKSKTDGYDIILMDLQLPEMSGFEAIQNIRLSNSEIPIIVQTAFSEQNERDKAFEAGCNYYLVKPITKRKLEDALLKFC